MALAQTMIDNERKPFLLDAEESIEVKDSPGLVEKGFWMTEGTKERVTIDEPGMMLFASQINETYRIYLRMKNSRPSEIVIPGPNEKYYSDLAYEQAVNFTSLLKEANREARSRIRRGLAMAFGIYEPTLDYGSIMYEIKRLLERL